MKKKLVLATPFVAVLFFSAVVGVQFVRLAAANFYQPPSFSPAIYIKTDGSIDPSTASIQRDGAVYTFTNNITRYTIVPECNNIVIDGGGYTLKGNGANAGVFLYARNNVTVKNMEIRNFYIGILIYTDPWAGMQASGRDVISGNTITNNTYGIWISNPSWNNVVSGNTVYNNSYGIRIQDSSNNVLRNNKMNNNGYNFWVDGALQMSNFIHDIDASNTVDGKPIYYWVNERDRTVPSNAGYVALVNCTGITIQNLNLTHNREGVLLVSTTNSIISKNHITNNGYGIRSYGTYFPDIPSAYINIVENKITENSENGIHLWEEAHSVNVTRNQISNNHGAGIDSFRLKNSNIIGNYITANKEDGIALWGYGGRGNTVSENYIASNGNGITVGSSEDNTIYHNNFINNTKNAGVDYPLPNVWDNGKEGNYWSDYNGTDANNDGIGDNPYTIDENNQDRYPLMKPIVIPPIIIPEFPDEENPTNLDPALILIALAVVLAIILGAAFYRRKRLTSSKTP